MVGEGLFLLAVGSGFASSLRDHSDKTRSFAVVMVGDEPPFSVMMGGFLLCCNYA